MPLGEKLKTLRSLRGWSQRELASRAGVRQTLISELESGKKADTTGRNLRRLAEALNVSVDFLVGVQHPPNHCPAEGLSLGSIPPLPAPSLPKETEYV